ncbi:hypothetical protein Zmor_001682 [Zophobas morio]|uniref:Uncharacterized protein n=1 Tax=Zophobas morio TaxID=2755281 RepID=A0AA38J4G5_9CUCU|nr:hypothetical protein Zmor_001682 [Zophobas morio]
MYGDDDSSRSDGVHWRTAWKRMSRLVFQNKTRSGDGDLREGPYGYLNGEPPSGAVIHNRCKFELVRNKLLSLLCSNGCYAVK